MKKKLNSISIMNELQEGSSFFRPPQTNTPSGRDNKPKETPQPAQKVEQVSKPLSKGLSNNTSDVSNKDTSLGKSDMPTAEDIELMSFQLRKVQKTKVNTQIAEDWKEQLNEMAFKMRVGKYELLEFIIGNFLGKVQRKQ